MLKYIILCIIILLIIILSNRIEYFSNNLIITSILPMLNVDDTWIVVTISNDPNKPQQLLQYTHDFKKYTKINITGINKKHIIKHIAWSKDTLDGRKLLLISQIINEENDESYKIYESKKQLDILNNPKIHLDEFKQYRGNDIKFIMCDMNNNYIGLKKHIKKDTDTSYIYKLVNDDWIPVDTYSDLRLKKIFFDKDNYLCCIAEDNLIYKKKLLNWKKSTWEKNPSKVGQTPVLDVVFDIDGKLIASTNSGIVKQIYPFYHSAFSKYQKKEIEKDNQLITKSDIFKFKTGLDIDTFDFLNINDYQINENNKDILNNEIKKFNAILNFKSQFLNSCKKSERDHNPEIEANNSILSDIRSSINDLKSKGYINVV